MKRSELIDLLCCFIKEHFTYHYWERASRYSYSTTKFAVFNAYSNFMLHQELCLHFKTDAELLWLITLKDNIINNQIKIMESKSMLPLQSYCLLFDRDGSVIITNKR